LAQNISGILQKEHLILKLVNYSSYAPTLQGTCRAEYAPRRPPFPTAPPINDSWLTAKYKRAAPWDCLMYVGHQSLLIWAHDQKNMGGAKLYNLNFCLKPKNLPKISFLWNDCGQQYFWFAGTTYYICMYCIMCIGNVCNLSITHFVKLSSCTCFQHNPNFAILGTYVESNLQRRMLRHRKLRQVLSRIHFRTFQLR
jgi:hypothetical protein